MATKAMPGALGSNDGLGVCSVHGVVKYSSFAKCGQSGINCQYWINYYRGRFEETQRELANAAKRIHEQRAELVRLYAAKTPNV